MLWVQLEVDVYSVLSASASFALVRANMHSPAVTTTSSFIIVRRVRTKVLQIPAIKICAIRMAADSLHKQGIPDKSAPTP